MRVELNPLIVEKLEAFGQRRRSLIIRRGICAGVLTLLASMAVVTLIDELVFLSDSARWLLSALAYGTVGMVAWMTCLRLILRIPGPERMARLIESARPDLREDLISAVELGNPAHANTWDSTAFRRLLQDDVAERMSDVDSESLLPGTLIRRWVRGAGIAGLACIVLLLVPGLRFGQRITRAMLPMADIERVSDTTITIVQPSPADLAVPQGEPVDVVVELAGPTEEGDDDVRLQIETEDGGYDQLSMVRAESGTRRYRTTLQTGRQSLHYRIQANDARTRQYLVLPRERPHVTMFHRTLNLPDYLGAPVETESTTDGNLHVVEGTRVDLVVETNQPVTLAHVQIRTGGETETVAITPEINSDGAIMNRLRGRLIPSASGQYRVHLVAAETGFDNRFSPDYEISVEPDRAPAAVLTEPTGMILAPADEIITLRGRVSDDWALDSVNLVFVVNQEQREPIVITSIAGVKTDADVVFDWDLHKLTLEPGDELVARLEVVDRKEQRHQSEPLKIVISTPGFDARHHATLAAQRDVLRSLARWTDTTDEFRSSVSQSPRALRSADALLREQAVLDVIDAAGQAEEHSALALEAVRIGLNQTVSARVVHELVSTAQLVGLSVADGLDVAAQAVSDAAESGDDGHLKAATRAAGISMDSAELSRSALQQLVTDDHLAVVAADLMLLESLLHEGDQPNARPANADTAALRLERRARAVGGHIKLLDLQMQDLVADDLVRVDPRTTRLGDELHRLSESLPTAAGNSTMPNRFAKRLPAELQSALNNAFDAIRQRSGPSLKQLQAVSGHGGTPTDVMRTVSAEFARLDNLKRQLGEKAARGDLDSIQRDATIAQRQRDNVLIRLNSAIRQFELLALTEEARSDADSKYVADIARAGQVLQITRDEIAAGQQTADAGAPAFNDVAGAVQVVDATHRLSDLIAGLIEIHDADDGLPGSIAKAMASGPLDWRWAVVHFDSIQSLFESLPLATSVGEAMSAIATGDEYRTVTDEMSARPQRGRNPKDVSNELQTIIRKLSAIRLSLRAELEKARSILRGNAPAPEQMLANAAQDAREIEQGLRELAESQQQDAGDERERRQREAREALAELQDLAEDVDDVRDALRRDANEQDAMTDAGRERARRDDDAAAALRNEPQDAANALRRVADAAEPEQQRAALDDAIREQAELAERLEQIADTLQRPDGRPEPVAADEPVDPEEAERNAAIARMQEQLAQLAELAQADPREALQQLEAQLQASPRMQQALDDISRDAIDRAQQALENVADEQERVAREIPEQPRPREELARQLEEIGREAQRIADEQIEAAQQELAERDAAADQQPTERNQQDAVAQDGNRRNQQPDADHAAARENAQRDRALERAQEQLERIAEQLARNEQREPAVAELAAIADGVVDPLERVADALQENAGARSQQRELSPEQALRQARNAAENAQQAAERAQEAAGEAQQRADDAQAAEQANDGVEAAEQLRNVAEAAAIAAENAQAAIEQANQANDADEQLANDANPAERADVNNAAQQAEDAANEAVENARQAAAALQEAAEAVAQLNERNAEQAGENNDAPETQAQRAAQQAAEAAANAAEQAQAAAAAANERAEAAAAEPDANQNEQAGAEQTQADEAAAEALEAAAEAAQQAADAALAAQQADNEPDAARNVEQARDQAQQAADQAGRAAQQAEQATPAQAAAESDQVDDRIDAAAEQVEQLAERAEQLAEQLEQLTDSAQNQAELAEQLEAIAEDIAQAARNEQRLENPGDANQLNEIAEATEAASEQVADVGAELMAGEQGEDLGELAAEVQQAVEAQAEALAALAEADAGQESGPAEPGSPESGADVPGTQGPSTPESGTPESGTPESGTPESGTPESGTPESGTPESGTPEPGTPEPGTPEPGTPEPGTPEPGTPEPGTLGTGARTPEPGTPEPGTPEPGTPEPGTPEPGTPEPGTPESAAEPGRPAPDSAASASQGSEPSASQPQQSPGSGQASQPSSEQGSQPVQPAEAQPGEPQPAPPVDPQNLTDTAAEHLARALDQLDRQLNGDPGRADLSPTNPSQSDSPTAAQAGQSQTGVSGQPGQSSQNQAPSREPGQNPVPSAEQSSSFAGPSDESNIPDDSPASAAESIAAAVQSQAQATASARSSQAQQSSSPVGRGYASIGGGAAVAAGPIDHAALPPITEMKPDDWGRLPPRLARDLREGSREKISPQFRSAVEAYFRVIAERARERNESK